MMVHALDTLLAIASLTALAMGPWAAHAAAATARIDSPAVLIAMPAPDCRRGVNRQLVISVSAFKRPGDASEVSFVVSARAPDGAERELGNFAIFPYADFDVAPDKDMRFGFDLPPGLATCDPLDVKVRIAATRGAGKGASIVVSRAQIL